MYCGMSNSYVACPITVCVFSCREQWIHSVHCGTALLCKWKSVLKSLCVCVCVCARLCSYLWKWAFNTITSWAIINSLLKYWALYPWKHVSAAIEVKQWLTLAVIDFWSCYCQRIHLIEKIFWTLAVLSGSSYLFTLKSTWNKNWHNLFLLIRVICLIVHNSSKLFMCGILNQNVITCF